MKYSFIFDCYYSVRCNKNLYASFYDCDEGVVAYNKLQKDDVISSIYIY